MKSTGNPLPVAVVDEPVFDEHRPLTFHPERPERLAAARQGLASGLPQARRLDLGSRPASDDELSRVHASSYVQRLHRSLREGTGLLDADTYFGPGSEEAALHAVGGAIELAAALVRGDARAGVALLRPPGHHATPAASMGFCMLNNIALAAAAAIAQGLTRIAIVDWDVHHGNGTQDAFYDDPRVLFTSLHQWPLYPGTGHPEEIGGPNARGRTINVALPAGSGPPAYGEAFRRLVCPVLDELAPELVLVSAGFDAHRRDPLAGMNLDDATFGAMASALLGIAGKHGGRVGFVLEGGYDLQALENGVCEVARAIEGKVTELPVEPARAGEIRAIDRTIDLVRPYWKSLGG